MRVFSIVHEATAGPGVFAGVAAERGDELVEWMPSDGPRPALDGYGGVLVLGGSMHPDQEREHSWLGPEKELIAELLERGVPLLGVCLGAELLAEAAGGATTRLPQPHIGWTETRLTDAGSSDPVLGGLRERFVAFQWHSYASELPPGGAELASADSRLDAFRIAEAWAIQFHAEVTREIVEGWLDTYRDDRDAVGAGFEPQPVREETRRRIDESNRLGADLFGGFLEYLERSGR